MGEALVRGIAFGALYGVMAAALALVFKATRTLSFAHGEIGGVAAFVAWWAVEREDLPWAAGGVGGVATAAAVGLAFHLSAARPALRVPPMSLTIATAGLLLVLVAIETKIWGQSPRSLRQPLEAAGPAVFGYHLGAAALLGMAFAAVVAVVLPLVLHRTDTGLALAAMGHDPEATRLTGIRVGRLSAGVWTGSSAIAGAAAVLLAPSLGGFAPGSMTLLFVRALAATVIGGMGRVGGAIAGGLAVGVVEQIAGHAFATSAFPGVEAAAVLAMVVLVLLLRPGPVLGERLASG